MDWYTWVFSGIGVAVLGWIANTLFQNKGKGKRGAIIKGDNNVANQNTDNSNITINK